VNSARQTFVRAAIRHVISQSNPRRLALYPLIFSIFMMAGARTAWRRNPLYSVRSTLRSAIVVLLGIAALVGLIVATVQLTQHSSTAVVASAMAAVVTFGTLAFIFLIMATTVPTESRPAALPHNVKLVTDNRRKVYKWLKVFAVLIVIFALGGLIPGPARYISLSFGGMTLLLAVILLPVYYFTNRGFDQSLTAVELDPWVHWQYSPEQWQQWCTVQADRLRATPPAFVLHRDWHRFLLSFAIIIGGVAIFCPGSWIFKTLYLVAVCAAILTIAILSGRGGASHADKLHVKLLAAAPETYFGHDGVFSDGVFTPWLNVSTWLVSATIDERAPRSLLLNFERSVPNPYGPTSIIPIHQPVLIPANAAADLTRLQQELTARCPKAQIALA
jgi:hypothetical protein